MKAYGLINGMKIMEDKIKDGKKTRKISAHAGHRERMRKKFREQGIDCFEEHEVLEILLYFAVAQKNTNELAHSLLNTFGSLAGVLNAPEEELLRVPGVGDSTVMLLKFIPQLFRRYSESASQGVRRICTFEEAGEYFFPKFLGRENETVFLMLMDARGKILFCDVINEGSVNASNVYIRDVVRLAVRYNASSAVLAHNHPSGTCLPSTQDLETTRSVASALESVEVLLMDHIIVGGDNYLSLAESGILPDVFEKD